MNIINRDQNIKLDIQEPPFMRILTKDESGLKSMLEKEELIEDNESNTISFKTENKDLIEYLTTWNNLLFDPSTGLKKYPIVLNMESCMMFEYMILQLDIESGYTKRYICKPQSLSSNGDIILKYL